VLIARFSKQQETFLNIPWMISAYNAREGSSSFFYRK